MDNINDKYIGNIYKNNKNQEFKVLEIVDNNPKNKLYKIKFIKSGFILK